MNKNRNPRKKLAPARAREADAAAAFDALLPPRTDSSMYESWAAVAKACGFFKESTNVTESQRFAEQLKNPDPHGRLSLAMNEVIAVLEAMERADARASGKAAQVQRDAEKHELIKKAIRLIGRSDLLEKPYRERAIALVFKNFAAFKRIEGMPTAQSFVRRLRGRKPAQ